MVLKVDGDWVKIQVIFMYCHIHVLINTQLQGVTSPRFHCEARYKYYQPPNTYTMSSTYNNSLYRDSEKAYCICQFEANQVFRSCTIVGDCTCTIVGDYCMDQDNSTASNL